MVEGKTSYLCGATKAPHHLNVVCVDSGQVMQCLQKYENSGPSCCKQTVPHKV